MAEPLFTPGVLTDVQALSEASMPENCLILRSPLDESAGTPGVVPTDDWGNPLPDAPIPVDNSPGTETQTKCRIAGGAKTEQERLVAGRLENPDLVVVALPLGTNIKEGDTIEVRGLNLEVVWVPDPLPTNAIDIRVMAQRES